MVHGSSCAVWFNQVSIPYNTVLFWSYLDELPLIGDVLFAQETVDRAMRLAYYSHLSKAGDGVEYKRRGRPVLV